MVQSACHNTGWGTRVRLTTAVVLLLLGLPLLGLILRGVPLAPYLEFPPLTPYVAHAPFSWPHFLALAAGLAVVLAPFVWRWFTGRSAGVPPAASPPRSAGVPPAPLAPPERGRPARCPFPSWGWLGLGLIAIFWFLAWTRLPAFAPLQRHTFTPLWLGYILVVNALVVRRTGTCRLTAAPGAFLALFPLSAAFWWTFEYLNRFVQNWVYVGVEDFTPGQYVLLAALSFSTVLPAVLSTRDLLLTCPTLTAPFAAWRPVHLPGPRTASCASFAALLAAAVSLALIGVYPDYLFGLLWIAPLLLLVALQSLAGRAHVFTPLRTGDWRGVVTAALAALVCGVFWELWNWHALAKWTYAVPLVQRFHLFEMPLLGYAGYLPFGLECVAVGEGLLVVGGAAAARRPVPVRRLAAWGVAALLFLAALRFLPAAWCARDAAALWRDEPALAGAHARAAAWWVDRELGAPQFSTGSRQFDGEWLFGTYMMAGMGFAQYAAAHPAERDFALTRLDACARAILRPATREFDRASWGSDPLDSLAGDGDHAAFLGYYNLLLSQRRLARGPAAPADDLTALNDRITAALVRRFAARPLLLLLQTYPGECYPVDNSAVIGSIGVYDRATGADHGELLRRWEARCRAAYVDRRTGLLVQAVHPETGAPIDAPRGSGTALAVYFLAGALPALSRDLYAAVKRELADTVLGFGVVREYPCDGPDGDGDIDSGPVVLGYGMSATGFSLAGARLHGDAAYFARLYAPAHLFGAPRTRDGRRHFATGGPIGDAILFAMLTAPHHPEGETP